MVALFVGFLCTVCACALGSRGKSTQRLAGWVFIRTYPEPTRHLDCLDTGNTILTSVLASDSSDMKSPDATVDESKVSSRCMYIFCYNVYSCVSDISIFSCILTITKGTLQLTTTTLGAFLSFTVKES